MTSDHEPLQRRVESIIQLALSIVTPLSGDSSLRLDHHRTKRPELGTVEEKAEDTL